MVVLAVLAVLSGILIPNYIHYVERTREAQVKQEAAEVHRAGNVAVTRAIAYDLPNTSFNNSAIKKQSEYAPPDTAFKTAAGSYNLSKLSNFWLKTSAPTGSPNYDLAQEFISVLGFEKHGSETSSVPISNTSPGSDTYKKSSAQNGEAAFQVLFRYNGSIATEYYRNDYFIRIEGDDITVVKVEGANVPFSLVNTR